MFDTPTLDLSNLSAVPQLGEAISLFLIFLSFAMLSYLSIRAKSIKSLQFQMFVVVLILVVAEVPRVLESLGLLLATNFVNLIGLSIHTISMIFLSVFLIYRVKSFASKKKPGKEMSQSSGMEVQKAGLGTSISSGEKE